MNGTLSRAAFAAAASWTEAYTSTGARQLRLVSESLTLNYDKMRSAALLGSAAEHEFYNGHLMISGELVVDLAYDNSEILAYCTGASAGTVYTFSDQLSKWFHLVIDKNTERWMFAGCKVTSFTISGEPGETPVRLSMQVIARSVAIGSTAWPSVVAVDEPVFFKQFATCWLGLTTDTLSATHALPIKSFEISVDNALQGDAKDSSSTSYVIEPIRNGFRKVSVKLGLARYLAAATSTQTAALVGWKIAGTHLSLSLACTNATDTYTFAFPELMISDGANWNVAGPSVIESEITLEAFRNRTNTGTHTAITDQMQITAV